MVEDKIFGVGTAEGGSRNAFNTFYVGEWYINPSTCRIQRGQQNIKVEPRVMQVLQYLARQPGETVSRQSLEASVWSGTVVGYEAVSRTIAQLRKALEDDPRNPSVIETVSKHGYRLIAPVRVAEGHPAAERLVPEAGSPRRKQLLMAGAVLLVCLIAISFWIGGRQERGSRDINALPDKSIAVLPFEAADADADATFLANGVADDLITELTKISGLLVISRESSFRYKRGSNSTHDIGKQLGARYLLKGRLQHEQSTLRLSVRLVETSTDIEIWADRYNESVGNLVVLQDKIVERIITSLKVKLTPQERVVLSQPRTRNPAAYQLFVEARERFFRSSKEDSKTARLLLTRAINQDSSFAMALAYLAWTHVFDTMNGWSPAKDESLALALENADRAIAIQNTLPLAYFVKGLVYREKREFIKALAEVERATQIDPNYANAYVLMATLLYYAERPTEGLARMQQAIRLNPLHSHAYAFHLGQAYFLLKDYPRAIEVFLDGLKVNPTSERMRLWLAASYAEANELDSARWEIEQALLTNPTITLSQVSEAFPFINPADTRFLLDSLRRAGLPG